MPLSPRSQALYDKAEEQRKLCRDWLIFLMTKSRKKPVTKEALREEAIKPWGVSKKAFDAGWTAAIEQKGFQHWYEPSRKLGHKT